MKTALIACGAIVAAAGAANAGEVHHIDVNSLEAVFLSGDTTFDVGFTGSIRIQNQDTTSVALAEFLGDPPVFGVTALLTSYQLDLDFVGGSLTGGTFEVVATDNTYTATVNAGSNPGSGLIFDSDLAELKVIGISTDGTLTDTSAGSTFFGVGSMDIFNDLNGMLFGTFDELNLTPTSDLVADETFDTFVNVDSFVSSDPIIPLPSAAGLAFGGLLVTGARRRRA